MKLESGKSSKNRSAINFGNSGTLRNRLWILQAALVLAIIAGFLIVLILTGTFEVLNGQSFKVLNGELEHTASRISKRFYAISFNTCELSDRINQSINRSLEEQGLKLSDLSSHPEIVNDLLDREVEKAVFAMQKSNGSGVFVILDTTVNPSLPDAGASKAGFYIKDVEPHPVPYSTNVLYLLRGSPDIARNYEMYLDTEWQLEFDLRSLEINTDFYYQPFNAGINNKEHETWSLGYWSPPFKVDANSKTAMAFSVPLRDNDGRVYGVCGLEISERFFNADMPAVPEEYKRLFYLVGINENDRISVMDSMHLGAYSARFVSTKPDFLSSVFSNPDESEFRNYYFGSDPNNPVVGLQTTLDMYNSKSVFKDVSWVLVALLPSDDVSKTGPVVLTIGLLLLLFFGIGIAHYMSRFYTRPISQVFQQIIAGVDEVDKTNITEIDDLIEFLKQGQMRVNEGSGEERDTEEQIAYINDATDSSGKELSGLSDDRYNAFTKQLSSLTKTEREIFDMYIKGYTAKQICDERCLSINTVKTHNRHIYAKMNVSSRAELLSYCIRLMQEYSDMSDVTKP